MQILPFLIIWKCAAFFAIFRGIVVQQTIASYTMCGKQSNPEVAFYGPFMLGNDYYGEICMRQEEGIIPSTVIMGAAILHMQGISLARQPFSGAEGVLLWNGEIFGGEIQMTPGQSDTEAISQILDSLVDPCNFLSKLHEKLLCKIEGPYAFVYHKKSTNRIYYGRDIFGRRSLLRCDGENYLLLCSSIVSDQESRPEEINVNFIYELDLNTRKICSHQRPTPFLMSSIIQILPLEYYDKRCLELLENSIRIRVANNIKGGSTIAILFSGGLDSTLLARLADKTLHSDVAIELITVAFTSSERGNGLSLEKEEPPDRISAIESFSELQRLSPSRRWIFSQVNVSMEIYQKNRSRILSLISPANTAMDLSIAAPFWAASTWPSVSSFLLTSLSFRSREFCL